MMTYQDRDRVIAWLDAGNGDKLTPLDRITLVTIAENVNGKTGVAFPGHELLIGRWGMSARSVKRAVARLCSLGLLETAQRGSWGRRSRYRLAGEVARVSHDGELPVNSVKREPPRGHTDPVNGATQTPYHGATVAPVYRSRLRSSNGEDDDDGATRLAPKGSLSAAPRQEIPGLQQEIMDALGYSLSEAKEWAGSKLNGKTPRNQEAYLRKCLENQITETHRKPATKKKTGSEFACPHCGRDDFKSNRSRGAHVGHCATTQCPDCNSTVKARDLDWHRKHTHGIDPWAERKAFRATVADQPPCIHGQPGCNIPKPDGTEAGWMICPLCRNNARRSA
jgi:hypothetical protein